MPTRKQLALTLAGIATGTILMTAGAYLSLVNIAPQQARVKARSDYIKQRLRKMLDD